MYLADCHTHTHHSPDAFESMEDMAAAAVRAGLDELCFTDHFEALDGRSGKPRARYDWSAMVAEFQEVSQRWADRIQLRLGLELGDVTISPADSKRLLAQLPPLDFTLGSQHKLSAAYDCQDLAWLTEPDEAACHAEIRDYLDRTLELARWGGFNALGHLTLPLRYMNERRGFHVSMDGYGAEIEAIFRALIENGCGIEVNTNRGGEPLPGARWLRLYRAMGGEIVTIGSDAHRSADVGRAVRRTQELLQECGFSRFCTFSQGQPQWHAL